MGCGLPERSKILRGWNETIRLDEEFEGFKNFENGLSRRCFEEVLTKKYPSISLVQRAYLQENK